MEAASLKFKTIVLATDLGDVAPSALKYAQALAGQQKAKLIFVHVIDPLVYAFPEGEPVFHVAGHSAHDELKQAEEETRALGIPIHSVVATGDICERILEALRYHKADLLIIGTRGKTEAGRLALGTIARRLLAKAPCPVMTVSPYAESSLPWAGCWRRVLAATDFSPASIAALTSAHQSSLRQLITLHVSSCQSEEKCSNCRGKLRFMAPFNESHTVPVEHHVISGNAGEIIPEYARKFDVDLIVLGSPTNELAAEDEAMSTVLQVIANVSCPVLCVPFRQHTPTAKDLIEEVAFA